MPITYATFNPSDKGANVILSNGNLTMRVNPGGGTWNSVRSTIGVSSGKWYWEQTLTNTSDSAVTGIGNSTMSLANYCGFDANGWSYYGGTGEKIHNNSFQAYASSYGNGTVISVALDMDGGTIKFFKNGVDLGTAYTGLTGTIFAVCSADQLNEGWTANFGASAFNYSVPSGYNSGLYSGTANASTNFFQLF